MPILGGRDERKVDQPHRKSKKDYNRDDDIAAQLMDEEAYKDYCKLHPKGKGRSLLSRILGVFTR